MKGLHTGEDIQGTLVKPDTGRLRFIRYNRLHVVLRYTTLALMIMDFSDAVCITQDCPETDDTVLRLQPLVPSWLNFLGRSRAAQQFKMMSGMAVEGADDDAWIPPLNAILAVLDEQEQRDEAISAQLKEEASLNLEDLDANESAEIVLNKLRAINDMDSERLLHLCEFYGLPAHSSYSRDRL
eukprot:1155307-Amphidinium_carterae.1